MIVPQTAADPTMIKNIRYDQLIFADSDGAFVGGTAPGGLARVPFDLSGMAATPFSFRRAALRVELFLLMPAPGYYQHGF